MITIQKVDSVRGEGGMMVDTWVDFTTIDVNPHIPSGMEYVQARSTTEKVYIDIYLDYDETIKTDMRVLFMDYTLEIETIIPKLPDINDEYRKMLVKCYEINI